MQKEKIMGIHNTEEDILKELQELSNPASDNPDEKPSEEVLEEAQEELNPVDDERPQEEGIEEVEEEEAEEVSEEEEVEELEEEPEEELTGAKFRHKLKAEKEARERLERELQEIKIAQARQEGRQEATPTAEAPQEEIPDQEYEPEKYAIWKADKLEKELQRMQADQARINAERQWERMEVEYGQKSSTYNDAKKFLIESETASIKQQYPHATDAQIAQHLKEQEYSLVGNAARAGIDPLQHIEFLAYQAGYRAEAPKVETPKKKANIQNIKKNVKKSASLIGGTSAAPTTDHKTAEQLAAMSIAEIEQFGRERFEKSIRKIEARS